tara:strand:+ start:5643 stop:6629 length:987 start_codon:yes stop_codon:yes gene_type:complete
MDNFYKKLGPISYENILLSLDINHNSLCEKNLEFNTFKGINNCSENDLTFLYDNYELPECFVRPKGIIISDKRNNKSDFKDIMKFIVSDVHISVAKISNLFYRDFNFSEKRKLRKSQINDKNNITKSVIIKNGCKIGNNAIIGDGSIIHEGCTIGKNVQIGSNTVIKNAIIGDNVQIESNCSIGHSGFGFAFRNDENIKIYHIGRVIIQDNCYIGSNCTIDRGSFSDTCIGENVYIDNQVHLAHNVSIGSNSIIAGQSGIAGSTNIGNYVRIGGQVGIVGHVNIGNNVEIAAKSGVRSNIKDNQKIMGDPAINMFTHLKKILKENKSN